MFATSITLALYVSAVFIALLAVGGVYMAARAADTQGRYAKRKAWRETRIYCVGAACAVPAVGVLVILAACAGQVLAGGAA